MISSVETITYGIYINDEDTVEDDFVFDTYEEAYKIAKTLLKEHDDIDYVHVVELRRSAVKLYILTKTGCKRQGEGV